jgi:hypothetical protein
MTTTQRSVLALPRRWVVLAVAVGMTIGYGLAVDPVIHSPAQLAYPAVWLAVSAAALWVVRDAVGSVRPLSAAVGVGYTALLLWTAGLLSSAVGETGLAVHLAMPGWGPAVVYTGPLVTLRLVPFLVVGYATLGALAALALDQTLRTTAAGALGFFACVSCSAPLFAGIAGSLGAGSLSATLSQAQYPVATAAFVLSVGLLTWLVRSRT